MKKKGVVFPVILLAFAFCFLWIEYWGPKQNDAYKDEVLHKLESELTQEFEVIESSAVCMKEDSFFIWAGVVIKTDLALPDIEKHLEGKQFGTAFIQCLPYSHKYAAIHGFTGIQKELYGSETGRYYFVFITTDPKTDIDKRILYR